MSYLALPTSSLQSTERTGQRATSDKFQSPYTASIHLIDNDSLLNVFYLYRPFLLGEYEHGDASLAGGNKRWVLGRWWYKLAHVCQRWRNLILASISYLDVCLVCTTGTPVADMLAHSPPLPLVIEYIAEGGITAEDEEGAILALKQRDRVRRVRLGLPVTNLQRLIVAIDEEYPIMEYLVVLPLIEDNSKTLILPETLQAPHLRNLVLKSFALPIASRLLTTAVNLVTLYLYMCHPSPYIHPDTLFRWLSFMPQLETLAISFLFAVPSREVERQLTRTPIRTTIILPNLHHFSFRGVGTYLEALVHRITTPLLEKLEIRFFNQLTFFVPRLRQFISTLENLRFDRAKFEFYTDRINVAVYPRGEAQMHTLSIMVDCWHLDWQLSSIAQISNLLGQMFSSVEHLTLEHKEHRLSSKVHNEVDRTEWRKLLRSFSNVKALWIDKGLVEELSRCLQLDDGEHPLELLPELQELTSTGSGDTGATFTSFIDARQNAGRPVTLDRRGPSLESSHSFVPPVETSSAPFVVSSNFTLSSGTTSGSSVPSFIFDHKPRDEFKTNAFANQLKRLYRDISHLETKLRAGLGGPQNESRIQVVIEGGPSAGADEVEKVRWTKAIEDHKRLSEMMLNLLEICLATGVPPSLRNIPDKHNIIIRLWTSCFHRLLENLRRSSLTSRIALEYLQEFIYYAYTFYTVLLERDTFKYYRASWLEALGDLARYRIVIAAMVPTPDRGSSSLTTANVNGGLRGSHVGSSVSLSGAMSTSGSEKHPARPYSLTPSVGIVAARLMELEPEKDRWRGISRDWYARIVAEFTGRGKLHHHLGLLIRDAEGEDLRAVYHFVKSMIANNPFETARESVLPLWSQPAQARRSAPDARAPKLFVFLHGMLFTNIQLDDFSPTLARLIERLSIEELEAREWTMMAAINIGALLEYGRPQGVLRRAGVMGPLDRTPAVVAAATKLARKAQTGEQMEVDGDERGRSSDMEALHPPTTEPFRMAQELTFSMLAHALRSTRDGPNPYVTVLLTFLQSVLQNREDLAALERAIPWTDLAAFLSQGPRVSSERLQDDKLVRQGILLEDWAIRGMAWHGRRLFERGYWDDNDDQLMEMEMLDARTPPGEADSMWEDDLDENEKPKPSRATLAWRRTMWASLKISNKVSGFRWDEKRAWWIDGVLAEKARQWEEEARLAREEERRVVR